jgi:hypothetical protein
VFRLYLLFHLFLLDIVACQSGFYSSCVQKINDANAIINETLSIPVSANRRLIYSTTAPQEHILKHDPFLGLYLVKDNTSFAYDFKLNTRLNLQSAVVDKQRAIGGKVISHQVGLNKLALFNHGYRSPALLLDSCCVLEGLATTRGIIEQPYISHFLSNAAAGYGDIGVRLEERQGGVYVVGSDPFMQNNPFKKGDIIVAFDGAQARSAQSVMQKILFSKIGSRHKVRVKRSSKTFDVVATTHKRYGGGFISDTFLESKGIYFDENLAIKEVFGEFKKYGLLVGDRLLWVNGVSVKNQMQLRAYMQDFKDYSSLLFERRDFQFFVNIK